MIRVLIVDDSFLMRKLLSDMLSSDPDIEVVGTATNGLEAFQLTKKLDPDVITMDLEMGKMDGVTATKKILKELGPKPIIIVSAYTPEHADAALACLSAGAFSCIPKPSGPLSLDIHKIQEELIQTVKVAAKSKGALRIIEERHLRHEKRSKELLEVRIPSLIVIGSSTGGPPAVEEILSQLPVDHTFAIVVIQHMPKYFTKSFAERLDRTVGLKVKEADGGEIIKADMVVVAPGDRTIVLRRHQQNYAIEYARDVSSTAIQPNIDAFMESAALEFEGHILGIILTGMGEDGTKGMQAIKRHGGRTIVQEPSTCIVDSMPRSVIKAGSADEILPLNQIAQHIVTWAAEQR